MKGRAVAFAGPVAGAPVFAPDVPAARPPPAAPAEVAAVREIGSALSGTARQRSVLRAFFGVEEVGLWGSRHLAAHPLAPRGGDGLRRHDRLGARWSTRSF